MTDASEPLPLASGINVADPNRLAELATDLREILGSEWIRQESAAATGAGASTGAPAVDIVGAFERTATWEECLRKGDSLPEDAELLFRFSMVAHVLSRAKTIEGFEAFQEELRSLARARAADRFYDKVFEAEVAIYFSDRMGADWARFGPKSGHPDIWAGFPMLGSQLLLPTECKRINPQATHNRDIDALGGRLETHLRGLVQSYRPMKAILWLHATPSSIPFDDVRDSLSALVERVRQSIDERAWITLSDGAGRFQLSLALLGHAGEFQPPGIEVPDVPAAPALLVRSEIRRTSETETEVRITGVLSIRSDIKPPPIGNFRERLNEAIEQIVLLGSPAPGAVTLRIRPPRDLGDIYEHDRIVRARLGKNGGDRIALVMLFWHVAERIEA